MCEEVAHWWTSVLQVRTILLKFAKLLGQFQEHVSYDQVAEVSAKAKPSVTGNPFVDDTVVVIYC